MRGQHRRPGRRGMFIGIRRSVLTPGKTKTGTSKSGSRDWGGLLGVGALVMGLVLAGLIGRVQQVHQRHAADTAAASAIPETVFHLRAGYGAFRTRRICFPSLSSSVCESL